MTALLAAFNRLRGSSRGGIVTRRFTAMSRCLRARYNGDPPVRPRLTNLTIFNTLFVNVTKSATLYVDPACRSAATFDYIATDETLPLTGPRAATHIGVASENDLRVRAPAISCRKRRGPVATGGTPDAKRHKEPERGREQPSARPDHCLDRRLRGCAVVVRWRARPGHAMARPAAGGVADGNPRRWW